MKHPLTIISLYYLIAHSTAENIDSDDIIRCVESKEDSWPPSKVFPENVLRRYIEPSHNVKMNFDDPRTPILRELTTEPIPKQFDAREKWPFCRKVINYIRDQGECLGSWAFAAAGVISDRICISSNGSEKFVASAEDILQCCDDLTIHGCTVNSTNGCSEGYPLKAFFFWSQYGVVSGGNYFRTQAQDQSLFFGCKPTTRSTYFDTKAPPCLMSCPNLVYRPLYDKDKHYGGYQFRLPIKNVQAMQGEIMKHGPIVACFQLHEDYLYFTGSSVYRQVCGKPLRFHCARIVGWGEGKYPYWLLAESFGKKFGMDGFVRMIRGKDHLGIESGAATATAAMSLSPRFEEVDIISACTCNLKNYVLIISSYVAIVYGV